MRANIFTRMRVIKYTHACHHTTRMCVSEVLGPRKIAIGYFERGSGILERAFQYEILQIVGLHAYVEKDTYAC